RPPDTLHNVRVLFPCFLPCYACNVLDCGSHHGFCIAAGDRENSISEPIGSGAPYHLQDTAGGHALEIALADRTGNPFDFVCAPVLDKRLQELAAVRTTH